MDDHRYLSGRSRRLHGAIQRLNQQRVRTAPRITTTTEDTTTMANDDTHRGVQVGNLNSAEAELAEARRQLPDDSEDWDQLRTQALISMSHSQLAIGHALLGIEGQLRNLNEHFGRFIGMLAEDFKSGRKRK